MRATILPAACLGAAIAGLLVATGCLERHTPSDIRTHPEEWTNPMLPDFHGTRVEARGDAECLTCHQARGVAPTEVPTCTACHDGPGDHPLRWAEPTSPYFHGAEVAAEGPGSCAICHGADYRGGWSGVSCYACHNGEPRGALGGHPDGWMNPIAASFHGKLVFENGVRECTRCHGFNLSGGTSGRACGECHE
jgi:hypothetical protein